MSFKFKGMDFKKFLLHLILRAVLAAHHYSLEFNFEDQIILNININVKVNIFPGFYY
jgi:hypothetical protein